MPNTLLLIVLVIFDFLVPTDTIFAQIPSQVCMGNCPTLPVTPTLFNTNPSSNTSPSASGNGNNGNGGGQHGANNGGGITPFPTQGQQAVAPPGHKRNPTSPAFTAGVVTNKLHAVDIYDGATAPHSTDAFALGFNLLGVHNLDQLNALPDGALGAVWVPICDGASKDFINFVSQFKGNPKLWGFYVWDEPQPAHGSCGTGCACPLDQLKPELEWIRANIPGAKTATAINSGAKSNYAGFAASYDYVAPDPYPCIGNSCDFSAIARFVNTLISAGVPKEKIAPMYQSFGGGGYLMPNASQTQQIIDAWAQIIPSPAVDFVYAWNWGTGTGLKDSPENQAVFKQHNSQ